MSNKNDTEPKYETDSYYRWLGLFLVIFMAVIFYFFASYIFHLADEEIHEPFHTTKVAGITPGIFLIGLAFLIGGRQFARKIGFVKRSGFKWTIEGILFWLLVVISSVATIWWTHSEYLEHFYHHK